MKIIEHNNEKFVYYPELNKLFKYRSNLPFKKVFLPEGEKFEIPASSYPFDKNVINLTLVLTKECNLSCRYCFESPQPKEVNSGCRPNSFLKAIDYFSERYPVIRITFFGGEPLLEFDTVKNIVKYCSDIKMREKNLFYFKIISNGTLITNEIADFLKNNLFNIEISCDGSETSQNTNRPAKSGNSFLMVRNALEILRDRSIPFYCQSIFTEETASNFEKDVNFILSCGAASIGFFPCEGRFNDTIITRKSGTLFVDAFNDYIMKLLEQNNITTISKFVNIVGPLKALHNGIKLNRHCGSGLDVYCITEDLKVYPCSPFVGNCTYCLGDLKNGIELVDNIHSLTVEYRDVCKKCWARHLCGGGCYFSNLSCSGSCYSPNPIRCYLTKSCIETAFKCYASLYKVEEL